VIEKQPGKDWRDLQCRVAQILQECGLVAETAITLNTARGKTEVDVYAKDSSTTPESIYLCECKRWASRVPQGEVQAFRTVVNDEGANFGLFISSQGFQSGAYDVVQHTNIQLLDWEGFQRLFLERWCTTFWIPTVRSNADALAGHVDPPVSDAAIRLAHNEPITPAEAVGFIVLDLWGHPFNSFANTVLGTSEISVSNAIWQCRNKYSEFLPKEIANAKYLRELMNAIIGFSTSWLTQRKHRGK